MACGTLQSLPSTAQFVAGWSEGRASMICAELGDLEGVSFWGLRGDQTRDILFLVAMRLNGYISLVGACWIEGRACPRRYLSFLPSHVRANLFGCD